MNEEMTYTLFGAFLGLFFGVIGKLIYDSIARYNKRKQVLNGFITELTEIKYQYVISIYLIYSRYGLLRDTNVTWLYNNLECYSEREELKNVLDSLKVLKVAGPVEFARLCAERTAKSAGLSLIPKKTKILFIEQNLHYLDLFNQKDQYNILKIMKSVDRLNQQIEIAKMYDVKTFEVEDPDNHRRICLNLDLSLENLGIWQEQSVNDINKFIEERP